MSMPSVLNHSSGNASSVLWRPETKWGWKCSTSVTGLFTLMVLMVLSGCAATNARKLTTWSVLLQKKKKASSSPFIAPVDKTMKYIKEADERAKEKELKDKKTENIKKEAVKQARAAERKAKKMKK